MSSTDLELLEEYLACGLSEIFVIAHDFHEDRGGYQNEYTTETIVGKKEGKYVKSTFTMVVKFNPSNGGRSFSHESQEEITEREYRDYSSGHARVDSSSALQALQQKKQAQQAKMRRVSLFEQSAPMCVAHQKKLVARHNGKNGSLFWGCPLFPKCKKTSSFTQQQLNLYNDAYRS